MGTINHCPARLEGNAGAVGTVRGCQDGNGDTQPVLLEALRAWGEWVSQGGFVGEQAYGTLQQRRQKGAGLSSPWKSPWLPAGSQDLGSWQGPGRGRGGFVSQP